MKKYAVIYRIISVESSNALRPKHVEYLKSLLAAGHVVDGMKFPDYYDGCIQGVLVCQANSKEEVKAWFDKDPVISGGARTYEVREYEPMSLKT